MGTEAFQDRNLDSEYGSFLMDLVVGSETQLRAVVLWRFRPIPSKAHSRSLRTSPVWLYQCQSTSSPPARYWIVQVPAVARLEIERNEDDNKTTRWGERKPRADFALIQCVCGIFVWHALALALRCLGVFSLRAGLSIGESELKRIQQKPCVYGKGMIVDHNTYNSNVPYNT
jgi:hypothetical protein